MAWSQKKIRETKYKPFPGHDDQVSKRFHSPYLPNPNVVRIEVLSPSARQRYLNGGLYAITDTFKQSISMQLMAGDGSKPFYAIFNPEETIPGFGITASWDKSGKSAFSQVTSIVKSIPVVGQLGGKVLEKASDLGNMLTKASGIDTKSTGAATLKDFTGAEFNFNVPVHCKWYMPEQEHVARLSIARLLKMAYVRPMDMSSKDFVQKLTEAANQVFASDAWTGTMTSLKSIAGSAKDALLNAAGPVGDAVGAVASGMGQAMGYLGDRASGAVSDEDKKAAGDVLKELANSGLDAWMKVNEFFGGNLTINPFPVRLTLGHILDIEPLVISDVKFSGSKEQFISEDGTHIPLFVNAEISFKMWMTPDPKKGFIRWLGDDIFGSGSTASTPAKPQAGGTSGAGRGKKKKGAKKKGGKKK